MVGHLSGLPNELRRVNTLLLVINAKYLFICVERWLNKITGHSLKLYTKAE